MSHIALKNFKGNLSDLLKFLLYLEYFTLFNEITTKIFGFFRLFQVKYGTKFHWWIKGVMLPIQKSIFSYVWTLTQNKDYRAIPSGKYEWLKILNSTFDFIHSLFWLDLDLISTGSLRYLLTVAAISSRLLTKITPSSYIWSTVRSERYESENMIGETNWVSRDNNFAF